MSSSSDSTKYEEGKAESLNELFTSVFNVATGPREDNRVDHINVRYLLWKTMAEFPGIVELKSRDLVPLLLRFIRYSWFTCVMSR
jgi:U3 small nucleolar RNA-associated protein 20